MELSDATLMGYLNSSWFLTIGERDKRLYEMTVGECADYRK